jgi:hypothetical protein
VAVVPIFIAVLVVRLHPHRRRCAPLSLLSLDASEDEEQCCSGSRIFQSFLDLTGVTPATLGVDTAAITTVVSSVLRSIG